MLHIPYKPLSERMLHEPFWLGLMTVFVVMGVIGLVWCAKRHFPEKIEKLLAEEDSRNRTGIDNFIEFNISVLQTAFFSSISAAQFISPGTAGRSFGGRSGDHTEPGIRTVFALDFRPTGYSKAVNSEPDQPTRERQRLRGRHRPHF